MCTVTAHEAKTGIHARTDIRYEDDKRPTIVLAGVSSQLSTSELMVRDGLCIDSKTKRHWFEFPISGFSETCTMNL
jgi:hypothetical protein